MFTEINIVVKCIFSSTLKMLDNVLDLLDWFYFYWPWDIISNLERLPSDENLCKRLSKQIVQRKCIWIKYNMYHGTQN